MNKLPISLVVVTYNEEKNIERCLRSVPWASEIIVVDSYSQDNTVRLAHELGARVFQEKWKGYGRQKASAVEKAKFDWILSLDADEALSSALASEILQRWPKFNSMSGYLLPRISFHLGQWIKYGGWFPDYQLRLFHRSSGQWQTSSIHERVQVAQTEKLKNVIQHWVFEDISDQVITNDKYSGLQADALAAAGKKFSLWKLVFKPMTKFFETYLLKRGFLDGLPGFIISVSAAYSVFLKWAKLWDLERKMKLPRPRMDQ
jgi:glycosyltransferase involved in cell wall biosynthesis